MSDLKLSGSSAAASASLRIIAAGMVIAGLYYGSTVIMPVVLSIFIAFVFDPGVRLMERIGLPRWLGSLLLVLLGLAVIYFIAYAIYGRAIALAADMPRLEGRLGQLATRVEGPFARFTLTPAADRSVPTVRIQQESPWGQYLLNGIGSVFSFTVAVMFIPFLVFFMLTSKNRLWAATLNLFALDRRHQAEQVIQGISIMVRQYVLGNFLVAIICTAVTTPIFAFIGVPYALMLGPLSAFLNPIPYIGVVLALIPPALVGLVAFETIGPFVALAVTVVVVHVIAVNLLTPRIVGRRVKLSAISVTIALMFWGWLWGGVGLILAIPITAAFKAVCDNVRPLKALGSWLGET
jgi:predicted PurR-regulated permease PerM